MRLLQPFLPSKYYGQNESVEETEQLTIERRSGNRRNSERRVRGSLREQREFKKYDRRQSQRRN